MLLEEFPERGLVCKMEFVCNLLYGDVGSPQQYFGVCNDLLCYPVVCSVPGGLLKYDGKILGAYAQFA